MTTTLVKTGVAVSLTGVAAALLTAPLPATAETRIDTRTLERLVQHYDEVAYDAVGSFAGRDNAVLPERLEDGFQLGSVRVVVGSSTATPVTVDGIVDYGTTADGVRILAASDGQGMDRFGVVVDDAAQEHLSFDVVLPAGAAVSNEETGAVVVTTTGAAGTTLAPAVAVDAAGEAVPARYRIVGDQLEIDLELDGAELPVFVDPVSQNHWWGHRDWYSRADVRAQASWWGVVTLVNRVCGANNACRQLVSRYTNWVYGTWMHAKNHNMCLSMDQAWTGQITNIYAYHCTWG